MRLWNAGQCCGRAVHDGAPDACFVTALVAHVFQHLRLNATSVFLVGHGNGGMLAYSLAARWPAAFSGVAVVGGALPAHLAMGSTTSFVQSLPPLLHLHGERDSNVPLRGGSGCGYESDQVHFLAASASVTQYATRAGCADAGALSGNASHWTPSFGGEASCATAAACANDSLVRLCTMRGAGHGWVSV